MAGINFGLRPGIHRYMHGARMGIGIIHQSKTNRTMMQHSGVVTHLMPIFRPKAPDSCFTMSTGRSVLSKRQEDMATTAAVLPVQNSWVTSGRTPNEWEQPKANYTALPVSGGPENIQI
jgi:hypothetical protein